jgi:hypothetical protein
MHLQEKRSCVPCTLPTCESACGVGVRCTIPQPECDRCVVATCFPATDNSQPKQGVSKAALAGAIVGIFILIFLLIAGIWFFRKRRNARRAAQKARELEPKPEVPAPAEAVLSRPDPLEKPASPAPAHVRVFSTQSNTTINLDPSDSSQAYPDPSLGRSDVESPITNPFADQLSFQSGSDQSHGNLIPIALIPRGSVQSPATQESARRSKEVTSPVPGRPVRSPDLNLRLDAAPTSSGVASAYDLTHVNVSGDSVLNIRGHNVAESVRSDMSAGSRASYLSTGTFATDLFTESPTIVTRQQGRILGLSKAQVVEVPASFGVGGSPLASSHLTPTTSRLSRMTTARSIRSPLAQPSFTAGDIIEMDEQQAEASPFADTHVAASLRGQPVVTGDDRSVRTNGTFGSRIGAGDDADSIASGVEASITSAKRVVVATSNGRVVSSSSNGALSQASGRPNRFSFASEASSRADSILEAFPFVPPSVPPSPRSQQSFRSAARSTAPPSPVIAEPPSTIQSDPESADRRLLGISTFSNASSGLEAFPFELQIDSSTEQRHHPLPTAGTATRASLDTLALSRDLTAFPLAYDEDPEHSPHTSKYAAPSRKSSTTRARH